MSDILLFIAVFIVLLVPLMFIHELGHYWGAKRAGIRVEEFGLGFPPRALTLFKRGETTYSINWLPIGAFVRMTGEEDPSDPRSFAAAKKRWRLITLFAGPFMNFVGGFVILAAAYLFFATRPTEFNYRIMSVNPGSAAETLGIQAGDRVLSVSGVSMRQVVTYQEGVELANSLTNAPLRDKVASLRGQPIEIVVSRPDNPEQANSPEQNVTLRGTMPAAAPENAPLGVSLGFEVVKAERVTYSIPQAFGNAFSDVSRIMVGFVTVPMMIIERGLSWEVARPVSVVGITNLGITLIQNREIEGLFPFVQFAGFISLVLGLSNLLPLPALDGGRILFVLIEAIRGRRINPAREQTVHAMGMIFLLGFSVFIILLDIVRPITALR
jgi:regulator of sigma E protease